MRALRCASAVMIVTTVGAWACGSPVSPSPVVPPGVWGGDHVVMTVSDTATHLEFDCAHGDISGAIAIDGRGQFDAAGTWVREHGGPIRLGELPDSHPAAYSGSVASARIVLTIQLRDSNETIGTFTLVRASPGRVAKCL